MATGNFAQMTTKKLNALYATASDEDKKAIEEVLASRQSAQNQDIEPETDLTPEEQAAIDAAEANGGVNPTYAGKAKAKKEKMSDEDRAKLAEACRSNLNHRCQVVPFNTADWVDGVIANVIEDKKTNRVLYVVKTVDGRRVNKMSDSNLIKVFDDVVEPEVKAKAPKAKKEKAAKVELTPEELEAKVQREAEMIAKAEENIGKKIELPLYTKLNEQGEEEQVYAVGRIVSIIRDKRSDKSFYRISIPNPTDENPNGIKYVHKVVTAELAISNEELDEVGQGILSAYTARRSGEHVTSAKEPKTIAERIEALKAMIDRWQSKITEAQAKIDTYKAKLAELEAQANELEAPADSSDLA